MADVMKNTFLPYQNHYPMNLLNAPANMAMSDARSAPVQIPIDGASAKAEKVASADGFMVTTPARSAKVMRWHRSIKIFTPAFDRVVRMPQQVYIGAWSKKAPTNPRIRPTLMSNTKIQAGFIPVP